MRYLGTLLLVAGIATLAWVLVVWRWQDPFSYLLFKREQSALAIRYERRLQAFPV